MDISYKIKDVIDEGDINVNASNNRASKYIKLNRQNKETNSQSLLEILPPVSN